MNPILLAIWAYWWRAAPWARSGHLMASFSDIGIPMSNEINELRNRTSGHLPGPKRAADIRFRTSDRCTACGQPGHVAASCTHELWRPR